MGTNFYWKHSGNTTLDTPMGPVELEIERDDPRLHLGKRSAAGLYCWDCDVTLCEGGKREVHMGRCGYHDACPSCGNKPATEPVSMSSAGVELGFADALRLRRPRGVRSCASFSWAQHPNPVRAACVDQPNDMIIEDEYGREYTGQQMLDLLVLCPLQFEHSIGERFS
jgi:hypothetical protein